MRWRWHCMGSVGANLPCTGRDRPAALLYLRRPDLAIALKERFSGPYRLLDNKYYLDRINEFVFAGGARKIGFGLWRGGDVGLIDGIAINGSAKVVGWIAGTARLLQSATSITMRSK